MGDSQRISWTTAGRRGAYDPGAVAGMLGLIGWEPRAYEEYEQRLPRWQRRLGGAPTVTRRRPVEAPGFQYQRFGRQEYQRRAGAPGVPQWMSDRLAQQQRIARQRYGGGLARAAGGVTPGIQRRLAGLEQQQLLERAAQERAAEQQIYAWLQAQLGQPLQRRITGGGRPGAGELLGQALGGGLTTALGYGLGGGWGE